MHTFSRPQTATLSVERVPAAGECPECGSSDLRRYRVLSEGGWWDAVKCQECLHSLERTPAPALGSFVPLGTTVPRDAAGAAR